MSDDLMAQAITHILTIYGPAALPIMGLLLIIKYLLDKDKQRETLHKAEIEAEREKTLAERNRGDEFQSELLKEAKGHATLAEELKRALEVLARGTV